MFCCFCLLQDPEGICSTLESCQTEGQVYTQEQDQSVQQESLVNMCGFRIEKNTCTCFMELSLDFLCSLGQNWLPCMSSMVIPIIS